MREKLRLRVSAETPDHERLAQPRHAFQKAVAAAHEGDKDLLDQLLVPHDRARYLGLEFGKRAARALHSLFDLCHRFHEAPRMIKWSDRVMEY